MSCESCYLDEVKITNIPKCIWESITEIIPDYLKGTEDIYSILTKKDRIYYIIGIVIIILVVRVLFFKQSYKDGDYFYMM